MRYLLDVLQPTAARILTDKDVLVFLRVATSLLMPVLLICQSALPCCAISELLATDGSVGALAKQESKPCPCCSHSQQQQDKLPPHDQHSSDSKCPYCGGLLLHFAIHESGPRIHPPAAELLIEATKLDSVEVVYIPPILQVQVIGHPCPNTGMRLQI